MKKICEHVKVFDLEPFEAGDGETFRFRLEILQERPSETCLDGLFCGLKQARSAHHVLRSSAWENLAAFVSTVHVETKG